MLKGWAAARRWLTAMGGLGLAVGLHRYMETLDYAGVYYDRSIDPHNREFRGPTLVVFWHEYIPFPFYLRGHHNVAMLLSQHRDAEWLSQAARFCGFETIRGSTKRGGAAALREMMRRRKLKVLTMTPDGPVGPRRRMAQGPIYLSSRLGIPIVPFGLGYDRPWRLNTWDRFAVPRPFSRARAVIGPRIQIPPAIDRDGLEDYRESVERTLIALTIEAERWAQAGDRREGAERFHFRPRPPVYDFELQASKVSVDDELPRVYRDSA